MEQSESIKELAGALAKAQAELKAAEMTASNAFFKNKYADLGEVIKASRSALTKHGLSIVQPVSSTQDAVIVTTQLMHESGEWIRDVMTFPLAEARGKSLAQEAGSIITYLRRYSYAAMIGLYSDEDTDGGDAKPANTNGKAQKPAAQPERQPAPANGQVAPDQRPDDKLMERWGKLYRTATELGLKVESVDQARITAADLIEKGKALKVRIEEVEASIETGDDAARFED